jgi:hypothetical protein
MIVFSGTPESDRGETFPDSDCTSSALYGATAPRRKSMHRSGVIQTSPVGLSTSHRKFCAEANPIDRTRAMMGRAALNQIRLYIATSSEQEREWSRRNRTPKLKRRAIA